MGEGTRNIWLGKENLNRALSELGSLGKDPETSIGCTCFFWEVQKTLEREWGRETGKARQSVKEVLSSRSHCR